MKKVVILPALLFLLISASTFGQSPLADACNKGDLDAVKKAVESGADVNAMRPDGAPILASAFFWPEITEYLLSKGADPNGGTMPALMIAANHYSYEVIDVLLKHGADPNKSQIKKELHPIATMINMENAKPKPNKKLIKTWETQLKEAGGAMEPREIRISILENTITQTNCLKCIQKLVQGGANVTIKDAVGNDLITSKVVRSADLVGNFKSYGKILSGTYGMKVPAWFADGTREGSHGEIVKALIEGGAEVNYQNPTNGNTPLLAALGAGNTDAAKVLVTNGADVTILTPNNKDALSLAAQLGNVDLIRMIVEKGADLNRETWNLDQASQQYAKGFTPLTIAVVNNHVNAAKYLIEAGSKPKEGVSGYHINPKTGCPYNLTNKTAIYYAVENGNIEMIQMLMDNFNTWNMYKMEMKQPDNTNEIDFGSVTVEVTSCWKIKGVFTPSSYAKKIGNDEAASLLKSKGL